MSWEMVNLIWVGDCLNHWGTALSLFRWRMTSRPNVFLTGLLISACLDEWWFCDHVDGAGSNSFVLRPSRPWWLRWWWCGTSSIHACINNQQRQINKINNCPLSIVVDDDIGVYVSSQHTKDTAWCFSFPKRKPWTLKDMNSELKCWTVERF